MMTTKNFPVTWTEKDDEGNEVRYFEHCHYEAAKDACNELIREITGDEDSAFGMAELQNMDRGLIEKVNMGVNWSCEGTQDPARAAKVGEALEAAAIMAANFPYSGYTIAYTNTKDWTDEDRKEAEEYLEYFKDGVWCNMKQKLEHAGIRPAEEYK